METNKKNKLYCAPTIKLIIIDNQITLQLASDAPSGPGESIGKAPEYFNNNPFKINLA